MSESPPLPYLLAGDTIARQSSPTLSGKTDDRRVERERLGLCDFRKPRVRLRSRCVARTNAQSHFKWLAANVIDKRPANLADTPEFVVREFEGVKIAIFGIVLQENIADFNVPVRMSTSGSLRHRRALDSENPRCWSTGNRALTHQTIGDTRSLRAASGVDVVIGGHEHTLLESMSGHAPIFKMDADARELGRMI